MDTDKRRKRNARQSASFRIPAAINPTPFGVDAASVNRGVTTVHIVESKSWATEEGSLAESIIFPMGANRFAVDNSSIMKE